MLWISERGVHPGAHTLPFVAQVLEATPALGGDVVVDALASLDALAPRLESAAFLEPVQHGIDDSLAEPDGFARNEAHGFDDLVAVHVARREQSQNQELGHSAHERWIRLRHNFP